LLTAEREFAALVVQGRRYGNDAGGALGQQFNSVENVELAA
jgi:hypothetical protein